MRGHDVRVLKSTCAHVPGSISHFLVFDDIKPSQGVIAERIEALQYTSASGSKPTSSTNLAPDKETLQRKARKYTPREQRPKTTVVDTRPTEEDTTGIENDMVDLSVEQLESLIAELDDEETEMPASVQKTVSIDDEKSSTSAFWCQ